MREGERETETETETERDPVSEKEKPWSKAPPVVAVAGLYCPTSFTSTILHL